MQELAVNLTRYWPGNTGIKVPPEAQQRVPPGPAEITPCDVYRLIRGRTLWIIGCVARREPMGNQSTAAGCNANEHMVLNLGA